MILPALALLGPGLARTWAAAIGLPDSTLALTADGRFTARTKAQTLSGTYAVGPLPAKARRGNLKNARMVLFVYDLASLRKLGAPPAQIDALKRSGKGGEVGMRLFYVPEFPLLSDLKGAHFVDAKERTAASRRLLRWRPF